MVKSLVFVEVFGGIEYEVGRVPFNVDLVVPKGNLLRGKPAFRFLEEIALTGTLQEVREATIMYQFVRQDLNPRAHLSARIEPAE